MQGSGSREQSSNRGEQGAGSQHQTAGSREQPAGSREQGMSKWNKQGGMEEDPEYRRLVRGRGRAGVRVAGLITIYNKFHVIA